MTTVEDIVTEWLDDNAADVVRDEMDIESEVESQVEKWIDEHDADMTDYFEKAINMRAKDIDRYEAVNLLKDKVDELYVTLYSQREQIAVLTTAVKELNERTKWWKIW